MHTKIKLGEVVDLRGGFAFKSDDFSETGVPIIRISNIYDGGIDLDKAATIPPEKIGNGKNYLVESGDILIAMSGATTGKIGIVPSDAPAPLLQNQRVGNYKIKDSSKIDKVFLKYLLTSSIYQAHVKRFAAGAAQPNISASELVDFEISLPTIKRQREIAAGLSKIERSQQKRGVTLRLIDEYLDSVFIEMFGDPVTNPKKFQIKTLDEVVEDSFQNGAYFPKELYSDSAEGIEMVHMSDAFYGTVIPGNLKRVLVSKNDIERYLLSSNDILVARRSLNYEGSVKPCLIPKYSKPLIFESSLIRIRPNLKILETSYLFHYLSNQQVRDNFVFPHVTKSTISGINQKGLSRVQILVPPLDIQVIFRDKLAVIDRLRSKLLSSKSEIDLLFQSVLSEAFQ